VVKGVNFVDLADIGDPVEIAKRYEAQGADEIVFLDIMATEENRDTMYGLIEKAAAALSIPITVGGGIRSSSDVQKLLAAGASKASINSAAVKDPDLIRAVSSEFGPERIVIAIDAKRVGESYNLFINGGKKETELDLLTWAQYCQDQGAGEILLTSIDGDGTQDGYDIPMTKVVCDAVHIPVVASGGCGKIQDITDLFQQTDCAAALIASLVHYGKATVGEVKAALAKEGIPCR